MDETALERRLHLNMALIGGFMGGYAILNHHDIFGSAQTANMISLAMDAAGRGDEQWMFRIMGLLIYITGFVAAIVLSHKMTDFYLKDLSILADALVLFVIGFFPEQMNAFAALFPMFFATAFQWCAFKGADGFVSSSIFSTNNLRQCTTGFTEYLCTGNREELHRGKFYGKVLLFYHAGVILSFLVCSKLGVKGSWAGLLPVITAFRLCSKKNHKYSKKETDILRTSF